MAEVELKDFVLKLFPNKNGVRYSEILEGFSSIGINSMSDLEFIDEEDIQQLECLTRIEAKKLFSYISKTDFKVPVTDPETLEQVLSRIFIGTPSDRLLAIKNVLFKEEIYTGKDVFVIDTNKLRKEGALSNTELLKIEQYIKQHDKERFDDIRVQKTTNDKKEFIEYEAKMASQQIQLQFQVKMIEDNVKVLNDEIKKLSVRKQELLSKIGDDEKFACHIFGYEIYSSTNTSPSERNIKNKEVLSKQINDINSDMQKLRLELEKEQKKLKSLCQRTTTAEPFNTAENATQLVLKEIRQMKI